MERNFENLLSDWKIFGKLGDNIQVVLPSDLCPLFESKLEEGATYIMKNFKVQPNDGKVKFCDHPFTLVGFAGDGGSDIIPTKIPNIPNYKFNFKSFDDIKHGKYRADMLVEGATYIMKNFKVQSNDGKVKFCDHPFTLVGFAGDGGYDIIPTKIPNIPNYKFNFKSFDDIKHGKYRADMLVDIIGAVHEVKPDKKSFGSKKLPTTFSLIDASMNILTCSLWGKYQTEFLAKYNENACGGPVVVILKHAAIKEPQGIYDLQITNAWSGTKLIMDQDFKEAKDFKELLPPDFIAQTQSSNNLSEGSSLQIQNSQSSQYSAGSRYAFRAPVTHISQLITLPEDEIVTTVATPHHVCLSKHGWYYKSCAECSKQLITDTPPYKCKVDAHVTPEPIIKYRVEAEVRYEGHKAKFLFWDRECTDLISKTAFELQAIMLEAGAFDPHEYPADLDKITGKELAFKVKIQAKGKLSSVLTLKDDPEIIQYLKDQLILTEIPSQLSLPATNLGESSQLLLTPIPETSDISAFPTVIQ
ncbi:hypothetical protein QL285_080423 [Trifolium repens]|nr:hypothetical protein QL285_080423 [Trifolium repens]